MIYNHGKANIMPMQLSSYQAQKDPERLFLFVSKPTSTT